MATPGLSLAGFLDQQAAVNHLRHDCVFADESDENLTREWNTARDRLGAAMPNAGQPDIQPIPAAHQAHVQQILDNWQQQKFTAWPGTTFQLIEIDPLLAYQFTVDTDRSHQHCGGLNRPPTMAELVSACLPVAPQLEKLQLVRGSQSLIVRARSLNVQLQAQGQIGPNAIGIVFGVSLPYVHVVRFNGRCYLHNGFHRAFGARIAGATHVPCLLRDVADHASVGIRNDGATFRVDLLESPNPPTIAHFTQGRAHPVQMKIKSRVLHVSWADYVVPEE